MLLLYKHLDVAMMLYKHLDVAIMMMLYKHLDGVVSVSPYSHLRSKMFTRKMPKYSGIHGFKTKPDFLYLHLQPAVTSTYEKAG